MDGVSADMGGHRDGGCLTNGYSSILFDLLGGRSDEVDYRYRLGDPAAGLAPRQHQEILLVAAHTRGEVIQCEEPGKSLRVGLVAAKLVDEVDLPLDQGLTAPR